MPLLNADDNRHASYKHMSLGNYVDDIRIVYGLMTRPGRWPANNRETMMLLLSRPEFQIDESGAL